MGILFSKGSQYRTSPEEKLLRAKYIRYWPLYVDTWFDMRDGDHLSPGIDSCDAKGELQFFRAAWNKRCRLLTRMIRGHYVSEIDVNDSFGRTALHFCSLSGSDPCVAALIGQKTYDQMDIDLRDNLGRTALMYAVFRGRTSVIRRLLSLGADVNAQDYRGLTSLMIASSTPYLYFADLLTEQDLALRGMERRRVKKQVTRMSKSVVAMDKYPHIWNPGRFEVIVLKSLLDTKCAKGPSPPTDVSVADAFGMTALAYAAKFGHVLSASKLLEAKASIESADKEGMSPLMHATANEHHEMMRYLLLCSADKNACNKLYLSALHLAIGNDDKEGWAMLIENQADIHAVDGMGQSPILLALKRKNQVLFETLIALGASLSTINARGWNIVMQAINSNLGSSLSAIFNRMTDMEGRKEIARWADPQGWTALHHAVNVGSCKDARMLLELDPDSLASMGDCNGTTPLHMAAENDSLEILQLLSKNIADLSLLNNSMETPLHVAAHSGSLSSIIELLCLKKHLCCCDASLLDSSGRTLLMRACIGGNLDCVRILLQNMLGNNREYGFTDPQINAQDNSGQTALMHATLNGHWEILTLLAIANADIHCVDDDGFNALHCAASEGEVYCAQTLLDLGIAHKALDKRGNTPLHCAAEMREAKICLTLLDFEADISARNYSNETALAIAINLRSTAVSEVLCQKMREVEPVLGVCIGSKVKAHGKFVVTIKECKDLRVRNFETTNAYVMMQFQSTVVSGISCAFTSAVCSKSSSPSWHESFEFDTEFLEVPAVLCVIVLRLPDGVTWLPLDDRTRYNDVSDTSREPGIDALFLAHQKKALRTKEHELLDLARKEKETHQTDQYDTTWDLFDLARSRLNLPHPPVSHTHLPYGFAVTTFRNLRALVGDDHPLKFDVPLRGCTLGGRIKYEVDFCPRLWECTHDEDERRMQSRRLGTPREEDLCGD